MFIKPVNIELLNDNSKWIQRAANLYLTLESKDKPPKGVISNIFSSIRQDKNEDKKTIYYYDFRIVLNFHSESQEKYVVAVDDSFEKIHNDWNKIEQSFLYKINNNLMNIDVKENDNEIEFYLLHQFNEISKNSDNLLISQEKNQLEEMKNTIKIFDKKLKDELLLNFYSCLLSTDDCNSFTNGHIYLTKNYLCFHNYITLSPNIRNSPEKWHMLLIAYKDIYSIDRKTIRRKLLSEDCIDITTMTKMVNKKILYFSHFI